MLSNKLPKPDASSFEVIDNTSNLLEYNIFDFSFSDCMRYVNKCKEKGYIIDAAQNNISYKAYNKDGYKLELNFNSQEEKFTINLSSTKKYGELNWPEGGIIDLLPMPTTKTGEIKNNDEHYFKAILSNTYFDMFQNYVDECIKKGFDIEAKKEDKRYYAKNKEGYKLLVSYEENGIASIHMKEPEYNVSINVECIGNLFFSKYDVLVYVGGVYQEKLIHGEERNYDLVMPKGKYEIKFVSAEGDGVVGSTIIDIYKDENLKYKIYCTSSKINVDIINRTVAKHSEDEVGVSQNPKFYKDKNYLDVEKFLVDDGFTNISLKILYDIVFGVTKEGSVESVSINDTQDYKQGDIFKKDASVIIAYHMKEEDDPQKASKKEKDSNKQNSEKNKNESKNVYYSNNTYEVVKKGNTGIYAYKDRTCSNEKYWIIDFDEGYVYFFSNGNGDDYCERVKMIL